MAEYYLKYPSLFADWTRPYRPPHTTLKRDSDPDLNKAGLPLGSTYTCIYARSLSYATSTHVFSKRTVLALAISIKLSVFQFLVINVFSHKDCYIVLYCFNCCSIKHLQPNTFYNQVRKRKK